MKKNFELIINDDVEWQTLMNALCNYLGVVSFEHLKREYIICIALLECIGVECV